MGEESLKRLVRQLKKREAALRRVPECDLVYGRYFSGKEPKYGPGFLSALDGGALKMVLDEYWAEVIYAYFRESGFESGFPDPALLSVLGLKCGAGEEKVKERFRRLAQACHPDHGGSPEEFMRIYEAYKGLKKE